VVICAAGTGSRLGVGVPKCLVSIDGRTIIDRQLDLLDDVPDIRVTVGYREDLVVRHVLARRPDAVFVRNPDYQTTATLTSLCRAVQHLDRPFVALDGDLLVRPRSFRSFLAACEAGAPLVGITPASTDDAVFVTVDDPDAPGQVVAFHRSPAAAFEWSGPAFFAREHLTNDRGYVYEAIEPHLPARAWVVEAAEVDTPDDLDRARAIIRRWDDEGEGG
jgi:choline kinase